MLARASLAMARALARIARRRRSTSDKLFSVSARLPPVSRCTLSAMMKKRNSGASMRLAISHSRLSRSRPSRMPASILRNSAPTGSRDLMAGADDRLADRQTRAQRPHHQIDGFGKQADESSDAPLSHAPDDHSAERPRRAATPSSTPGTTPIRAEANRSPPTAAMAARSRQRILPDADRRARSARAAMTRTRGAAASCGRCDRCPASRSRVASAIASAALPAAATP